MIILMIFRRCSTRLRLFCSVHSGFEMFTRPVSPHYKLMLFQKRHPSIINHQSSNSKNASNCSSTGKEHRVCPDNVEINHFLNKRDVETTGYTDDELKLGMGMINRILREQQLTGTNFILPVNDEHTMKAVYESIGSILAKGIKPEFFIDSCISEPKLFAFLVKSGDACDKILQLFVDFCQMTYEDSIRFFATYAEEMLLAGSDEIQSCLEELSSVFLDSHCLGDIVFSFPALLFARKSSVLAQSIEDLYSHFTKTQLRKLLKASPGLLLCDNDEVGDKIEYIFCHMLMNGDDFDGCTKLSELKLTELIDRHEFLLKTGTYITPDEKRPQIKKDNATLKQIICLNDRDFSSKIAGVTVEEWKLFKQIQEKKRVLNSEGKVQVFDRIKPTMRKKFERRRKDYADGISDHFQSFTDRY